LGFSREWPGRRPTVKAAGRQLKRCRNRTRRLFSSDLTEPGAISCFDGLSSREPVSIRIKSGAGFRLEIATRDLRKPAE